MGTHCSLAWRSEAPAPSLDGPGSRVLRAEFDGRDAQDAPVLHVYEDRTPVGVVGEAHDTARHLPAGGGRGRESETESPSEALDGLVSAQQLHLPGPSGVQELQSVPPATQETVGEGGASEAERDIRRGVQAGSGGDPSAFDDEPAPEAKSLKPYLGHHVLLCEPRAQRGVRPAPQTEQLAHEVESGDETRVSEPT